MIGWIFRKILIIIISQWPVELKVNCQFDFTLMTVQYSLAALRYKIPGITLYS